MGLLTRHENKNSFIAAAEPKFEIVLSKRHIWRSFVLRMLVASPLRVCAGLTRCCVCSRHIPGRSKDRLQFRCEGLAISQANQNFFFILEYNIENRSACTTKRRHTLQCLCSLPFFILRFCIFLVPGVRVKVLQLQAIPTIKCMCEDQGNVQ